jgi:hypothetical protein
MSQPLSWCLIQKAAKGDEVSLDAVLKAMKVNAYWGHFSIFGCDHKPHCEPATEEQINELDKKIKEATKDIQCFRLPKSAEGPKGVSLSEGWDTLTVEKEIKNGNQN